MVAVALRRATGDLLLGGRWTGTGEWLLREMMSSSAASMRCSASRSCSSRRISVRINGDDLWAMNVWALPPGMNSHRRPRG